MKLLRNKFLINIQNGIQTPKKQSNLINKEENKNLEVNKIDDSIAKKIIIVFILKFYTSKI